MQWGQNKKRVPGQLCCFPVWKTRSERSHPPPGLAEPCAGPAARRWARLVPPPAPRAVLLHTSKGLPNFVRDLLINHLSL